MVGHASNRSMEIGTLEHIIVIDASFDPFMYILFLSLYARYIPVGTFLSSLFYLVGMYLCATCYYESFSFALLHLKATNARNSL